MAKKKFSDEELKKFRTEGAERRRTNRDSRSVNTDSGSGTNPSSGRQGRGSTGAGFSNNNGASRGNQTFGQRLSSAGKSFVNGYKGGAGALADILSSSITGNDYVDYSPETRQYMLDYNTERENALYGLSPEQRWLGERVLDFAPAIPAIGTGAVAAAADMPLLPALGASALIGGISTTLPGAGRAGFGASESDGNLRNAAAAAIANGAIDMASNLVPTGAAAKLGWKVPAAIAADIGAEGSSEFMQYLADLAFSNSR